MINKSVQFLIAVHTYFLVSVGSVSAQQYIPVVGPDEVWSQYTCITIPNVSTVGVEVLAADGTKKVISAAAG